MTPQATEFRESNEIVDDSEALRQRLDTQGYLFFRELLDPGRVWDVRLQILGVLKEAGWLKADSDLATGMADVSRACAYPEPEFLEVWNNVVKLEAFNTLPHSPAIFDLMEKLIGEEVLAHPKKTCRISFPQAVGRGYDRAPAHQDWISVQGTFATHTCWTPLGDCSRELGGLLILAGSHKRGLHEPQLAMGRGGIEIDIDTLEGEWVTADFQIGDVLIFNSLTVHMGLPNLTPDKFRLSVDCRFSGVSQPVVAHTFQPHVGHADWDEVYAGWGSEGLQYYWEKYNLNIVPFDTSYAETRFLAQSDRNLVQHSCKASAQAGQLHLRRRTANTHPRLHRLLQSHHCEALQMDLHRPTADRLDRRSSSAGMY